MKSSPKLLLIGYSGKRNFGDDLLLRQAYNAFQQMAEIHIYCPNQDKSSDYLYGWFPNAVIHKKLVLKYNFLKKYTHILYFGGGIFFDYNRKINLTYYWKKRLSILKNFRWVSMRGTHFAGIGIGLGPFIDKKSEDLCMRKLRSFDYLNVRDETSLDICKNNKYPNVTLGQDLSLVGYQYINSFKIPKRQRTQRVIICPRKFPHGEKKESYLKTLLVICERFRTEGREVLVYGFQSFHDEVILEQFSKRNFKTQIWNPAEMIVEDLLKDFANCEFIISARMHGVYISGMLDVPVIGIGVHQKLQFASEFFSCSLYVSDNFEADEMMACVEKLNELPQNDLDMLCKKEQECMIQYELIKKWLNGEKNCLNHL